jgi:hypothetical protein
MYGEEPRARGIDAGWQRLHPDLQQKWLEFESGRGEAVVEREDAKAFSTSAAPIGPAKLADAAKTCPECAELVQVAAHVCRFCGYRFDGRARRRDEPSSNQEPSTSNVAIAAFICSLVGLWIAAIPLAISARRQIDSSHGRKTGRGFATAGLVLGWLGAIGTLILIIALIAAASHHGCTYTYQATGACVE